MRTLSQLYESWKQMRALQSADVVNYFANKNDEEMPFINGTYKVHSVKDKGWQIEVSLINTKNDKNPKTVTAQIPADDWKACIRNDEVKWNDENSYYILSYSRGI